MYLRHTTIRKDGKVHTYWRLVRSVRIGSRVRQETVSTLGELDEQGRASAETLARQFSVGDENAGTQDLFCPKQEPEPKPVSLHLDRVRVERGRRFGDVWMGWRLWQALRLDQWSREHLPEGRAEVAWGTMAAILVLGRLCEPSSELHIAEDWYRRTALDDLLGVPEEKVNEDRLYRALDELLPHKADLERHLKERLAGLFEVKYDLLLYDMTSTYFEGEALGNPQAQRGHSRDHRSDCKQVCIALVVTREGLPLGYEVFAGNTADVMTVEKIVKTTEDHYGRADRIWVMDRGMVSEKNLVFLRDRQARYVLGTPKSMLKQFESQLREGGWTQVRPDVEVKLCAGRPGDDTFLLCRSQDRKEKERAMHQRFAERIQEALESLDRRLVKARKPVDRGKTERQIGRLLGRNSRAAAGFDIRFDEVDDLPSRLRLSWKRRADWDTWCTHSEGAYLLRTNLTGYSPEDLWKMYIQLSDAESAFRMHKTDLRLRPIWHQREERVQAHILVCFLAFVLYKTLEMWSARAGLGKSPRTLLEEAARIQSTDVVLPTADGRELRLRCVVQPDPAQSILLSRLGLKLPKRLSPAPRPVEM